MCPSIIEAPRSTARATSKPVRFAPLIDKDVTGCWDEAGVILVRRLADAERSGVQRRLSARAGRVSNPVEPRFDYSPVG
jgi:hypothetical protein